MKLTVLRHYRQLYVVLSQQEISDLINNNPPVPEERQLKACVMSKLYQVQQVRPVYELKEFRRY
jgi:hypothetical protein